MPNDTKRNAKGNAKRSAKSSTKRNTKKEYQKEGFRLFRSLVFEVKTQVISQLLRVSVRSAEQVAEAEAEYERRMEEQRQQMKLSAAESQPNTSRSEEPMRTRGSQTYRRERPKLGRNDLCWCGSGKKYKKCHMNSDASAYSSADTPESEEATP